MNNLFEETWNSDPANIYRSTPMDEALLKEFAQMFFNAAMTRIEIIGVEIGGKVIARAASDPHKFQQDVHGSIHAIVRRVLDEKGE